MKNTLVNIELAKTFEHYTGGIGYHFKVTKAVSGQSDWTVVVHNGVKSLDDGFGPVDTTGDVYLDAKLFDMVE